MTEDTTFGDGVSEIEHMLGFIARSDIPLRTLRVIRHRRLKQKGWNRDEITKTNLAGAHHIRDGVFSRKPARCQVMNHGAIGVVADGDVRIREVVAHLAIGLIGNRVQRLRHGITGKSLYFVRMARSALLLLCRQGQAKSNS